ncbi:CesT family type III secretion system chaperone [Erwinia psidii]|uniref:Type III chaperone ShcV n=1 Tax=Erwinia psidii TaxID=69224 RepID=A0A3N6SLS1_9GAMM|nr:CesT family type III secretion system chaperone [Erwinia psidii]MCX8955933.1 type III chaperone ShcV [Erwinia psidii]MCX8961305.1 type III chaperone ShcV [Erwinia psidii]MCX8963847.1 type III chaperone ShcV [Erwinia psidii]RQM38646.1 type III chaperone ShcV [Erwinia psidii]
MSNYFASQKLFNDLQHTDSGNVGIHAVDSPDGIPLTLYVNGPSLTFLAEITPLQNTPQDDLLLRKMLAYAFPGLRLRGGALTINPDEKTLVYSYEQVLSTLSKTRFESLLANFSATAMALRQAAQRLTFS